MDSFKCSFSPCWRKDWSFFSSGDVTEDGGVAEGDVYQLEASGRVFADFDLLRLGLIFGKLFIVGRAAAERRDNVSATMLFLPSMCRMSVENSEMKVRCLVCLGDRSVSLVKA